jgi:hypothetical protein
VRHEINYSHSSHSSHLADGKGEELIVNILNIPTGPEGQKMGVDDYLSGGGTIEGLLETATEFSELSFSVEEWPTLSDEAIYGPAGDVVSNIEPNTESDKVNILLEFLSRFGNAIGRGAHFKVEGDNHYLKLNVVSVGKTPKGRKGTGQGRVNRLLEQIVPLWLEHCVDSGLSSGEGLIYRVRDKVTKKDKDGADVIVDAGVGDKRLLVEEPEFASALTVMRREGNTLSMAVRNAWDDKTLRTMTRNSDLTATNTHITVVGHITKAELYKHLSESSLGGGIANRFLFALVRRSKTLPFGGNQDIFEEVLLDDLRKALEFGRRHQEFNFSGEVEAEFGYSAEELWCDVYPELSEGEQFLVGTVTSRAESQVRRLATLYAVLDTSPVLMVRHVLAALAVWQYCEDSARILFGEKTGDRKADAVLEALREAGGDGLTKTDLYDVLDRHVGSLELTEILKALQGAGWITSVKEETGKPGPPPERWFIVGEGR